MEREIAENEVKFYERQIRAAIKTVAKTDVDVRLAEMHRRQMIDNKVDRTREVDYVWVFIKLANCISHRC